MYELKWRMHRLLHQARHTLAAPSRNPRTAVVVGRLLGTAFLLCFGTGLYSHFLQDPLPWMVFATRPTWLYQVTQGIHITAGIACFPLLFAKLYAVFPELFQTPPVRSFAHFLERASIALFVAASLVQITIGLLNTYQFYSLFPFSFRHTHYVLSFVVVGSLAIHIGVKLTTITRYWRKSDSYDADGALVEYGEDPDADLEVFDEYRRLTGKPQSAGVTGRLFAWIDSEPNAHPCAERARTSRRGFLATVTVATAAVVGLTAGQSFRLFDVTNLFAPRKNGTGPQGLPVNRTAKAADVEQSATSSEWRLTVANGATERTLNYAELSAMPQYESVLPIACVEGWSQYATWRGVRVKDLVDLVGADVSADLRIVSLQTNSMYGQTTMQAEFARDDLTLVALEVDGAVLDLDHGYPARIIAPARPGVLQTKWLSRIEVQS
ncbi:molybdopterin-dependent oxidoreductase [soil metagenome]